MPINPPGGLGHVPIAVYICAATSTDIRAGEELGRYYADARHWHVAGAWSDFDPTLPLAERPGWQAVTSALSAGMIRGIAVSALTHVATDAAQFASLRVLIRERGGFLVDASGASPVRRTPDQRRRRRDIADAASGWSPQGDTPKDDTP
ncbi:hypothetical protein [Streptomyces narbonensis]|uniref:hypothetical protein n=1 Tax=Streptomyces narbonensis TaxID=67333 RepID=UPI001674AA2D|nr:hypothetical protein [Streptomyces narbonensis]GGV97978.1 hypothetical protein GCM10010230_20290 [Streptomyces narbonensis]